MNETRQLHVYADFNLWVEITNIVNKSTESLLESCNKRGLKVNREKTKYTFISRHQATGQIILHITVANKSSEYLAKFKYIGTILIV
jgi:hypothetical protein